MKIKQLRLQKKLTLRQLAKLSGVSVTTISDLENGLRMPRPDQVEKIATILEVSPDDLYS